MSRSKAVVVHAETTKKGNARRWPVFHTVGISDTVMLTVCKCPDGWGFFEWQAISSKTGRPTQNQLPHPNVEILARRFNTAEAASEYFRVTLERAPASSAC